MSRVMDPREQHANRRGFAAFPAAPAPAAPAPFVPPTDVRQTDTGYVVVRTGRGVLHKGWPTDAGVTTHARCHANGATVLPGGSAAAFVYEQLRHPEFYCRYRWCFRDLIVELGLIPAVGHVARRVGAWRQ